MCLVSNFSEDIMFFLLASTTECLSLTLDKLLYSSVSLIIDPIFSFAKAQVLRFHRSLSFQNRWINRLFVNKSCLL